MIENIEFSWWARLFKIEIHNFYIHHSDIIMNESVWMTKTQWQIIIIIIITIFHNSMQISFFFDSSGLGPIVINVLSLFTSSRGFSFQITFSKLFHSLRDLSGQNFFAKISSDSDSIVDQIEPTKQYAILIFLYEISMSERKSERERERRRRENNLSFCPLKHHHPYKRDRERFNY